MPERTCDPNSREKNCRQGYVGTPEEVLSSCGECWGRARMPTRRTPHIRGGASSLPLGPQMRSAPSCCAAMLIRPTRLPSMRRSTFPSPLQEIRKFIRESTENYGKVQ